MANVWLLLGMGLAKISIRGRQVLFEGPALKRLAVTAKLEANISIDANGELLEHHTSRNEVTGGWRLTTRFRRLDDSKPVELRGSLRRERTLSETWSYILPPG